MALAFHRLVRLSMGGSSRDLLAIFEAYNVKKNRAHLFPSSHSYVHRASVNRVAFHSCFLGVFLGALFVLFAFLFLLFSRAFLFCEKLFTSATLLGPLFSP